MTLVVIASMISTLQSASPESRTLPSISSCGQRAYLQVWALRYQNLRFLRRKPSIMASVQISVCFAPLPTATTLAVSLSMLFLISTESG